MLPVDIPGSVSISFKGMVASIVYSVSARIGLDSSSGIFQSTRRILVRQLPPLRNRLQDHSVGSATVWFCRTRADVTVNVSTRSYVVYAW